MKKVQEVTGKITEEQKMINLKSAEEDKPVHEEGIISEKEIAYQKAVKFMKCIRCMTACNDKLEMYRQTAKQFARLSGYKNSDELAGECKLLVKQTRKEIKKAIYKRAKKKMNQAKRSDEFRAAAEEFRNISGYRDADTLALECDKQCARIDSKTVRNRILNLVIILLCCALLLFFYLTSYPKYVLAGAYKTVNAFSSAINIYQELGDYKDSRIKLKECQYQKGISRKEEGDFKNAAKAFEAAEDYKDSEQQKAVMEKLVIKNSSPGHTVYIGKSKWVILEIKDTEALLLKKAAKDQRSYHERREAVTWETSDLRFWLNQEFIMEEFTESERNAILLKDINNIDNDVYGTDAGENTQDYLFLLSVKEAAEYASLLPDFKSNSWLRTPGGNQSSAAFLSADGSVMDYGYDVTSMDMGVRPAMWFNLQ